MTAVFRTQWDQPHAIDAETFQEFQARLARLKSGRKVRPVVTRSGHRARGEVPSFKTNRARYESLLEKRSWLLVEVASDVLWYSTHPHVLRLRLGDHIKHYTPDALLNYRGTGRLLEVKACYFLRSASSRDNLWEVVKRLKREHIRLALLTDADVPQRLHDELALLVRHRPARGRYRDGLNASVYDPHGRCAPNPELERRWLAAQRECNELLARVMRRDPDELITSITE